MADVLVNSLTQVSIPATDDYFVMVDKKTNEGRLISEADLFGVAGTLVLDCGTLTELPASITDSRITEDMVAIGMTLGTPTAMRGDWTVNTSNGSLTISGDMIGSTTVVLHLSKGR